MGTGKMERRREVAASEYTLECTDFDEDSRKKPKGRWSESVFGNDRPVILELACGRGEYAISLARKYPGKNFVGVDIKGARLWKGLQRLENLELKNVRFLRTQIEDLHQYFDVDEVDEIWITFPDPFPKKKHRKKRLTSPRFLKIYSRILKPEGLLHLKTDSDLLFRFTLDQIEESPFQIEEKIEDVHGEKPEDELLAIQTRFEKKHLAIGKKIKYLRLRNK